MGLTAGGFSICNRYKAGSYPVATVWYKHGLFKQKDGMIIVYLKEGRWQHLFWKDL